MKQIAFRNKSAIALKLTPSKGLKFLAIAVLIFGVLLRFVSLDQKFYWADEVRTSLRTSGYTEEQVISQAYDGSTINAQSLDKYQSPTSEQSLTDTLNALIDHPEHPPLYYLAARFWTQFWRQWTANTVAATRSLSAVLGIMVFPCLYWLCLELFESSLVGWIAVMLVAVSPLHLLYAQEARQYSLWTVTILLSSAALLRAMRRKTPLSWGTYAASLVLGLYSHLLFAHVAIAQAIYILTAEKRWTQTLTAYCRSFAIALIAFAPWLGVIAINTLQMGEAIAEGQESVDLSFLINRWFRNINRVFFNADLGSANVFLVMLALYSMYFLYRRTPPQVWVLILSIIGVNALALILPDLLLGAKRSSGIRYLFPCYIGIQIALAYFFSTQIAGANWVKRVWRFVLIAMISAGMGACLVTSQMEVTWNKSNDKAKFYLPSAQTINRASAPLVISDAPPIELLTLSHLLAPQVWLQLGTLQASDQRANFSRIFLFNPSEGLKQAVQTPLNSQLTLIQHRGNSPQNLELWEMNYSALPNGED